MVKWNPIVCVVKGNEVEKMLSSSIETYNENEKIIIHTWR